jgi:hypothetical protein
MARARAFATALFMDLLQLRNPILLVLDPLPELALSNAPLPADLKSRYFPLLDHPKERALRELKDRRSL